MASESTAEIGAPAVMKLSDHTQQTLKKWLQDVKDQLKNIYSVKYLETEGGIDKKRAACWAIHNDLKPSEIFPEDFPNSPMIDFRRGRDDPKTLKKELKKVVERTNEPAAEKNIDAFVDEYIIANGNRMLGPVSVSAKTVQATRPQHPQYISTKVIELSLARQVVWEAEDGNFWDLDYAERKLIEASQLHSSCEQNVPHVAKELLPVMYWKETRKDTTDWVESRRTERGEEKLYWHKPPTWATAYINKERSGIVLGEEMQVFPEGKVGEPMPNKHLNAVYLLLCRFNGKGVPEDAKIQAYAGYAEHGVENRWKKHADASNRLLKDYRDLTTFSAEPLKRSLLVDVLVARLYAQGGSTYITDNDDEEHDNIALFVYRAYGEKTVNGKEYEWMKQEEDELIDNLNLRDMWRGMNLKGPPEKPKPEEGEK